MVHMACTRSCQIGSLPHLKSQSHHLKTGSVASVFPSSVQYISTEGTLHLWLSSCWLSSTSLVSFFLLLFQLISCSVKQNSLFPKWVAVYFLPFNCYPTSVTLVLRIQHCTPTLRHSMLDLNAVNKINYHVLIFWYESILKNLPSRSVPEFHW